MQFKASKTKFLEKKKSKVIIARQKNKMKSHQLKRSSVLKDMSSP